MQKKLSDKQVAQMRRLRKRGWRLRDLAIKYNITAAYAGQLCRGDLRR